MADPEVTRTNGDRGISWLLVVVVLVLLLLIVWFFLAGDNRAPTEVNIETPEVEAPEVEVPQVEAPEVEVNVQGQER